MSYVRPSADDFLQLDPEPDDEAWEAYLNSSDSPLPTNNYRGMSSEDLPGIEQTLTRGEDLYDHLNWQLSLSQWSEQERNVAGLIIGNLDENGYLANASLEEIAEHIGRPKAARAVGAAVGRNPISFVVPCHRVVGKTGSLCGYHWGLTRKRAIIGWETGALQDRAA